MTDDSTLPAESGDMFAEVTNAKQRAFLVTFAATGHITKAAAAAGIHRTTIHCPAWRDDEAFQAAYDRARQAATDLLVHEAWRRAVHGVRRKVGWYRGVAGGEELVYSDRLLEVLLKANHPAFRDQLDLKGALSIADIDVRRLSNDALQRIMDGESILSVLASPLNEVLRHLIPGRDVTADNSTTPDSDEEP